MWTGLFQILSRATFQFVHVIDLTIGDEDARCLHLARLLERGRHGGMGSTWLANPRHWATYSFLILNKVRRDEAALDLHALSEVDLVG